MYIIAGLGNPGREYKWTRHNVGFEVIDKLAYDLNIDMNKSKFRAITGEGRIGSEKVILVKPLTYMNLSGESIREFVNFYKTEMNRLIVCCDDINLPLSYIRVRAKGSDGGQNGLKNIIYQLGDDSFARIRIGIGSKPSGWDLRDFVLSRFTKEENEDIIKGITNATDALNLIVSDSDGISKAMNRFNKKLSKIDKGDKGDKHEHNVDAVN